ncbi:Leucine rich repeat-containing protein [Acetitomaculum ruminis DSM 5522]|uniref:Leucine rich repeat-containing protein n=1 Tax=Acetitomaculum ruminis DSM 5522 TaxID=1120918 RepID=A0A1I0ZBX1_9FIRM|nr:leucine-rich repeat domain-containing protein [Acetitomaculum ruminis]SFB22867.1 Leucine rich repeat-containing protein [Acetitomaculum ruminis DSM 5522]
MKKKLAILLVLSLLAGNISMPLNSLAATDTNGIQVIRGAQEDSDSENEEFSYSILTDVTTDEKVEIEISCYDGDKSSVAIPSTINGYKVVGIGTDAFYENTNITSVTIPEGVKEIKAGAFYGCSSLKTINLPKTLQSIGNSDEEDLDEESIYEGAFEGCGSLKTINIPEGVTFVNTKTFKDCTGLTSATLPQSLEEINANLFEGCTSLGSVSLSKNITKIDDEAFLNCESLKNISISGPVEKIGKNAFENCKKLESATLPGNLKVIDENAFKDCSNLKSIEIPATVTNINDGAFSGCSSLTTLNIPETVENIGNGVFAACTSLTSVTVDPKNKYFVYEKGVLYDINRTRIIWCSNNINGKLFIPETVTYIDSYAFEGSNGITDLIVESGVMSIGDFAFANCENLETVSLSKTLTHIGNSAFANCKKMNEISIPSTVVSIGTYAFTGCESLPRISLPDGLNYLGEGAFAGDISLASANIPANIGEISENVFKDCKVLKNLVIPEGITKIGDYAFAGNEALNTLSVPSTVSEIGKNAFQNCKALTEINIPTGVKEIKDNTFDSCSLLSEIIIPDGVVSIGNNAFSNCANLKEVHIPKGVTSIGDEAFSKNTLLNKINIPEGVSYLGEKAFYEDENLEKIYISKDVTEIKDYTFYGCSNLETAGFLLDNGKSNITSLGNHTFENCKKLGFIRIPEQVKEIGESTFENCESLKTVNLPSNLEKIGDRAFAGDKTVNYFKLPASLTSIGTEAFKGCQSVTAYSVDSGNKNYKSVNGVLFTYNGSRLIRFPGGKDGSYTIPDSTKSIEKDAFDSCKLIESVVLNENITKLEAESFCNCDNLETLTVTEALEDIGENFVNKEVTTVIVDPGSYAETYCKENGYKYSTIENGKLTTTITLSPKTAKYTGSAITIGEAKIEGSTGAVTYTYYIDSACKTKTTSENSGAAAEGQAPVNAGKYYVRVTVKSDANYNGAVSSPVLLTIEKLDSSITLKNKSVTYTGYAIIIDPASVSGSTGTVSYTYYIDKNCKNKTTTSNSKAASAGGPPISCGTYYVKASLAADATHKGATSNVATLKINKIKSTISLKAKTATYNGKAIKIGDADVTGSWGKITYKYYINSACTKLTTKSKNGSRTNGEAPVIAGTYYVKASVAATYSCNSATSKAVKLVINKAKQSITNVLSKKTVKFSSLSNKDQKFWITSKVKGAAKKTFKKTSGNSKIKIAKNGKVTVAKGLKRGKYTVKFKITAAATKNYKKATKACTVTITVN